MSDVKENAIKEQQKERKSDSGDWICIFLILAICFGGWGISESPRILELEKKVARLEGQISMIGGKGL